MSKHKIDINKNSLSWEKTFFRKCDNNDCNNEGKFKAPKSRVLLNQYSVKQKKSLYNERK